MFILETILYVEICIQYQIYNTFSSVLELITKWRCRYCDRINNGNVFGFIYGYFRIVLD